MARLNVAVQPKLTHEGARAYPIKPYQELRRSVLACMLWEKSFYESGKSIAARITDLVGQCNYDQVAELALEARTEMKLRHAPLLLCAELAKRGYPVAQTLCGVIQRPDEITEFLAIYSRGRTGTKKLNKLSNQVKKGIAAAFHKFDEYQLQKWQRDDAEIELRDALFLSHPKPSSEEQSALWKRLIDRKLMVADTWESVVTKKNDRAGWEKLLRENNLLGLALLKNMRNMIEARVDPTLLMNAIQSMRVGRILPYRFITAAKYAPAWEEVLEQKFFEGYADNKEKLSGSTVLLIDVSASMDSKISSKSEMTRLDAACGLAMLAREICTNVQVYTFSQRLVIVPPRRGFALRDAIIQSQHHGGTDLGGAMRLINQKTYASGQRLIVFTDEQSHTSVAAPNFEKPYMINVANEQYGVGYGPWNHIDGFSEAALNWIYEFEQDWYN